MVVGVIFACGTHAILVGWNHFPAATDSSTKLWLWPQSVIWWFFPGFGALVLSWEIIFQIWAVFGNREEAFMYAYWSSLKAGFDCTRALRWMAVLIVLPIGVLTMLELPVHAALNQDDLRDCGYGFAPCTIYRYADARRMTIIDGFRTRDSKLTRRAGIVIDFADGRRWSSADIGDFKAQLDPSLEEFLKDRTHLPYNYAQTEEDIPSLPSPIRDSK